MASGRLDEDASSPPGPSGRGASAENANRAYMNGSRSYYRVSEPLGASSPVSLLTLSTIRRYLRRSHAVMMTVFFAIVYALGSMVLGSMLLLTHLAPPYYAEVVWSGGAPSWNYPGLLIVEPWGVVTLPFFATFAMVVVSIGVGIGMAVAVLLGIALIRGRRSRAGRPAAVGSVAGLTPALVALVTLGACCSTAAAATAGVGLVGQASGTSTDNLLLNNWFLGVFQIVVVWVALLAQELLLRVYGGLFGLPNVSGSRTTADAVPPRVDRRVAASALLRVALLVGGITWSLAMLADWTNVSPSTASATEWFSWILQHQLVSVFAIFVALFPRTATRWLAETPARAGTRLVRVALLLGGITLVIGVPPPFASGGAGGLVNQVVGVLAGPAALGASVPSLAPGFGLYFSWAVQLAVLGGFAVAAAIAPRSAMAPLLWSVPDRPVSGSASSPFFEPFAGGEQTSDEPPRAIGSANPGSGGSES